MPEVTNRHTILHVASVFPATSNRLDLQCGYARDAWSIELLHLSAHDAHSETMDGNYLRTKLLPHWPKFRQDDAYLIRRLRSLVCRLVNAITLYVFLIRSRADIVHAHENSSLWAVAFWVVILRRPAVWDPHDFFHASRERRRRSSVFNAQMFLERAVVRRGTPIVAVSEGMQEKYASLYPDASVDVLRNYSSHHKKAIDVPEIEDEIARKLVESRNQIANGKLRLVYPGLIKPERFPLELIRKLGMLHGVSLDIYGEDRSTTGVNQTALEEMLSENRITNVHLRGRYTSDSIVSILSQYHFVILPYQLVHPNIDFCLPNKFYQCIEAGLPLITSDMKEMGGIITEHKLGYVFPSGDDSSCLDVVTNITATGIDYLNLVRSVLTYQAEEVDYRQEQSLLLSIYAAIPGRR